MGVAEASSIAEAPSQAATSSKMASEKKRRDGRPLTRKWDPSGKMPCSNSPILENILTEYLISDTANLIDLRQVRIDAGGSGCLCMERIGGGVIAECVFCKHEITFADRGGA